MVREKFYTFYLSPFKYLVKYLRLINNRKAVLSLRVRLKYTAIHFKGVYSRETVALKVYHLNANILKKINFSGVSIHSF